MDNLIFVYGTLRKGYGNNKYFLLDDEFICEAKTEGKYALYAAGIPFLNKHEQVCNITGEVYKVDDNKLVHIDALEGHPAWYKREIITVVDEDGNKFQAWVYFNDDSSGELIESGDYNDYRDFAT
jgi:gamma-glutamylaminecyclotransferase